MEIIVILLIVLVFGGGLCIWHLKERDESDYDWDNSIKDSDDDDWQSV